LPYLIEQSLVGFLEQSSRFLKPVHAGDTIYPAFEVTELVPGRTRQSNKKQSPWLGLTTPV
jgi:acyl dehydratase